MATTTPGRPRSFDVDAVVDGALDLFWAQGYRETSTRDLERALGVGQSSLYNTFGSKRDLLLRALDLYEANVKDDLLVHLEPKGGLRAVDTFLAALAEWIIASDLRGCLVVSLMSAGDGDPVIDERVSEYRAGIRRALLGAMDGTAPAAEVAARAEALVAACFGVQAIARSSDPAEVRAIVEGIRSVVAAWG